jgi:hypothetical protein
MTSLIRFFNPPRFRRAREAAWVEELKRRDGENCARCRRPIRFDFPPGHDQGPKVEGSAGANGAIASARLCHRRCNASGIDHTGEVTERVRRKNEAALFTKSRKKRRAA